MIAEAEDDLQSSAFQILENRKTTKHEHIHRKNQRHNDLNIQLDVNSLGNKQVM